MIDYSESYAAAKKSFMQMWWCHQFPPGFLLNNHLSRMSRLFDKKSENEMKPEAVHTSSIHLTAEENPRNPQLGDPVKDV